MMICENYLKPGLIVQIRITEYDSCLVNIWFSELFSSSIIWFSLTNTAILLFKLQYFSFDHMHSNIAINYICVIKVDISHSIHCSTTPTVVLNMQEIKKKPKLLLSPVRRTPYPPYPHHLCTLLKYTLYINPISKIAIFRCKLFTGFCTNEKAEFDLRLQIIR